MAGWPERLRRASPRATLVALVLGALVLTGLGGLVYAGIPDRKGEITGCYKKGGRDLRVIDAEAGRKCRKGERRLVWNQKGPKGDKGDQGPRGPEGPPGLPGPEGSPGRTGYTVVEGGDCGDIQAAIDQLPVTGGAVLVAAGTYVCSEPIVIDRDHVTLRGTGHATVIQLAPHANSPVLILGRRGSFSDPPPAGTRAQIQVADLLIDGNRLQQDFECHVSNVCAGDDFLRNNGISLRRVEDTVVEHVTVKSARSGGLVAEHGARRLTVRDFTSSDNHFDGLGAYRTTDSVFTGLHLHDNGNGPEAGQPGAGLSFDLDFVGNEVTNSIIANSRDVGVFMRDSRENIFSAISIRDSGGYGVFVAENADGPDGGPTSCNMFTGVVVAGSGRNPVKPGFGMRFQDASSTDNLVFGAQFVGNRDGTISSSPPGLPETAPIVTC